MNNNAPATAENIQNEIIVASLAHAVARTPKQRREAWTRLMELKRQRDAREPTR